jgi:hypothetical protein
VDASNYRPLPDDWALATADVVGSTQAIHAGRYKAVNMAGAAVIAALQNAVGERELPFVFGGDGALVALGPRDLPAARAALSAVSAWTSEELRLELRAAIVPLTDIRSAGRDVLAARFRVSDDVAYAMFAGGGASWADSEMKAGRFRVEPAAPGTRPDLAGLSCRFRPLPSARGTIASLIVVPGAQTEPESFSLLVGEIIALLARLDRGGHPLPAPGPAMPWPPAGVREEVRAIAQRGHRLAARAEVLTVTGIGALSDRLRRPVGGFDAGDYRADVSLNSDFRKFDDGLKMTVDLPDESCRQLEALLESAQARGLCRYGLHRQHEALVTCITPSYEQRDHVHFVDGAAGGYALAAAMLKASG